MSRSTSLYNMTRKTICQSGPTLVAEHRSDFESCPSCGHKRDYVFWRKAAVTLILEPSCIKSNSVAVVSECPKCFEPSWVHERIDGFDWDDWPEKWKERVKEFAAAIKLKALREWGAGICWRCENLASGEIEYHAWRHCVKGCGPPEKKCDRFIELPTLKLNDME